MALTRAMLKGMGLTDEQVSAIIEEHTSVTDALKEQRDGYKEEAEKLPKVQKELDELRESMDENDSDSDQWKQKYEEEHQKFEEYKADVSTKETQSKIKDAYKKLLAECKVGEKHIDSILRVTEFDKMKLDKDGALEDVDSLKEKINSDWAGFISEKKTEGASVETPPKADGKPAENTGRAAELAAKYHDNLYGSTTKEE